MYMAHKHKLVVNIVKTKLILEQLELPIMYNHLKKNMLVQVWDKDIQQNQVVAFNKILHKIIY